MNFRPKAARPQFERGSGLGRGLRAGIFAVALLARVTFQVAVVGEDTPPVDDAAQYDAVAMSVAQGGDFVTQGGLRSHRAPGYPLFLAGVYAIFGRHWSAGRLAQALIGSWTAVGTAALGASISGPLVGMAAGLGYALLPYAVYWSGYLLSEPLCALLTLGSALTLLRCEKSRGWTSIWALMCGLTALTRPNMALLFPLGFVWLLLRPQACDRRLIVAVVVFIATLTPWTVRNYLVHARFVPITTMGGVVLWEGNNPYVAADSALKGRSAVPADAPEKRLAEGLSEVDQDGFYFRLATEYMRSQPGVVPGLVLRKFLRLWSLFPDLESRALVWIAFANMALVLSLFLAGLVVMTRLKDARSWSLIIPVLAVTMTAVVYWADARIRAPAEPEIFVIAAIGGLDLWRRLKTPSRAS